MYDNVLRLSHVCSPFISRTPSTMSIGGSSAVRGGRDCPDRDGMDAKVISAVLSVRLSGEL